MRRRLIYATIILGSSRAAYAHYHKVYGNGFVEDVQLVFPEYCKNNRAGTAADKTVKLVSMNQLQYLLKTCSEAGRTVAPSSVSDNEADVFFDSSSLFNKVLKLDT